MAVRRVDHSSSKLSTELEDAAGRVRFVVVSEDRLYQDRVAHMGYGRISDVRFATAWEPLSERTEGYYAHFAASIEMMVLQSARLVPVPWQEALLEFLRRVQGTDLRWWLYGSAALAVRGVAIEPGDIDINVSDAWLAGRILDDLLLGSVGEMHGWVARCGGRAFHRAILEWLAEPFAEYDDPSAPHEQGPFTAGAIEAVEWCGHRIAVPPLSAQLRVCELRGLTDRAQLIRSAMRRPVR